MATPPPDGLERLARLVERLRAENGCPWDREQNLGSVRAYLLEEAHELAAAIDGGDWDEIGEELGDLLFQVAFVATLGKEAGHLDAPSVARGIEAKMIARHPHVFGDERLADAEAVRQAWERRKLADRRDARAGLLHGVAASLPALVQSYRMTQKASAVGFDWPDAAGVLAKIDEELAELRRALERGDEEPDEVFEEIGDLLFTVANLARRLEVDPESALQQANRKFRRRFEHVERRLAARGDRLEDAGLEAMDALWDEAKADEAKGAREREDDG